MIYRLFYRYFFLLVGFIIVTLHVYFTPFSIWTVGVSRPWFILHGFLPFRDLTWIRMPLDLFILSFWYQLFGVSASAYQSFVFALFIIETTLIFFTYRFFTFHVRIFAFIFFIIFLFPLFMNTQEVEMLISIFSLLLGIAGFNYLKTRSTYWLVISGVLAGICLILKQNTIFALLALPTTLVVEFFMMKKRLYCALKQITIFICVAFIPYFLFVLFYFVNNGLYDFFYYTIFLLLGPYRNENNMIQGDGLLIIAGYISLLIPFLIFWKKTNLKLSVVIFLSLLILSLFLSILPSYLSYRTFTAYGLISVVAGYDLYLFKKHGIDSRLRIRRIIVVLSFVVFVIFISSFIQSYIASLKDNGIAPGQLITDYNDDEYEIVDWLKTNTTKQDRILNYGSEMIYVLADRFPQNKYMDPFPFELMPFETTAKIFINNPPKIVIDDIYIPRDHPGVEKWPYMTFLHSNKYRIIKRYGERLVLYKYNDE